MREFFRFPDPVNETSARLVAAGVVVQALVFLIFREGWFLVPLVYGFVARVVTGPTMSPLGQFVTRVVSPRISAAPRFVPGPPKRFAQGIGVAISAGSAVAWLLGAHTIGVVLISLLIVAATLESACAICLGCMAYRMLWGCDDCDDISERLRLATKSAARATT
ncbi:MAG: DUF4395 domain-containing protein [Ilumatobacteraceae bacterium]